MLRDTEPLWLQFIQFLEFVYERELEVREIFVWWPEPHLHGLNRPPRMLTPPTPNAHTAHPERPHGPPREGEDPRTAGETARDAPVKLYSNLVMVDQNYKLIEGAWSDGPL